MENKAYHAGRETVSCAFEVKSLAQDGTFEGYASVFNVVDSQRDVVQPGAFRASLKTRNQPVQLLWQHQWESPIGVIETLFENTRGLYVKGKLLMEVARAREAYALLKSGVIRGLSIGYSVKRAKRNIDTGVRALLEVELWEISLVTMPANEAALVTVVKSAEGDPMAHLASVLDRAGIALLYAMGSPGFGSSTRPV
ncbi:MAG: HK97 family phage prohead protease [Pseudomonadota bacterium]